VYEGCGYNRLDDVTREGLPIHIFVEAPVGQAKTIIRNYLKIHEAKVPDGLFGEAEAHMRECGCHGVYAQDYEYIGGKEVRSWKTLEDASLSLRTNMSIDGKPMVMRVWLMDEREMLILRVSDIGDGLLTPPAAESTTAKPSAKRKKVA
jgi:hypothetical protein